MHKLEHEPEKKLWIKNISIHRAQENKIEYYENRNSSIKK
jgi:hypothetical protein